MSQNYNYPAVSVAAPVGGATAANQVLEIAQLTAINANTADGLTDAELRATPVPVSGTVSTNGLTDAELRASPVPVSLTSTTITGSVAVTGPLTDTELRATPIDVDTGLVQALTDAQLRAAPVDVDTGLVQALTDTQLRATPVPVSGTISTGGLTDAELRATPVPISGTVTTGGLTDTQLRATPVPVSLTSTTVTGSVAVTGPLTDTQLRASAVPVSAAAATPTAGTVTQAAITVGTSAVRATVSGSAPSPTRKVLVVTPDSASAAKFYIGSATVTSTSTTRGAQIVAGQAFVANDDAGDYYIVSDTASQTVYIMEQA